MEEYEPESRRPESLKTILKQIWNLSATEDQLFSALLPFSFVVLVVLAFFGRGAEMTVVAGFTAVCMAFLKLEKFSEFSGIGFSAKLREVEKNLEAITVRETEVDIEEASSQFGFASAIQVSSVGLKALKAIEDSKFTFRTASGISKNLNIEQNTARRTLKELEEKGLVSKIVTSRRTVAWNITALGRAYLVNFSGE
jgi:DNA-binding MarR family transcriptional regulator